MNKNVLLVVTLLCFGKSYNSNQSLSIVEEKTGAQTLTIRDRVIDDLYMAFDVYKYIPATILGSAGFFGLAMMNESSAAYLCLGNNNTILGGELLMKAVITYAGLAGLVIGGYCGPIDHKNRKRLKLLENEEKDKKNTQAVNGALNVLKNSGQPNSLTDNAPSKASSSRRKFLTEDYPAE